MPTLKNALPAFSLAVLLITAAPAAYAAQEFYAGDAVVKNGMELVPHYLTGVTMEGMPAAVGPNDVHLEVDVHAVAGETHGFSKGEWIPYLTISYTLKKTGSAFTKTGTLIPMTASDGTHYANNLTMDGPGQYHLSYHFLPPSKAGFLRHVDKASGVPDWWAPFDADWTFTYPSKPPAK